MSRFSCAARCTRLPRTGSWKASHHAASGSISEAALAANFDGTSNEGCITGVEQPEKTSAIDAATAAATTRAVRRSTRGMDACPMCRGQAVASRGNGNRHGNRNGDRLREMDRNGDGVITHDEWRGDEQMFRNLDRNGDNQITQDEVRQGRGRNQQQRY